MSEEQPRLSASAILISVTVDLEVKGQEFHLTHGFFNEGQVADPAVT